MPTLAARLMSFVVERFPFALPVVRQALEACLPAEDATDDNWIERLRPALCSELTRRLVEIAAADLPETTPGVKAVARLATARDELVTACDGFLIRQAVAASLSRA